MVRIVLLLVIANLCTFNLSAQDYSLIIFKDKKGSESLSPSDFLTQEAISRRNNQGIELDSSDFPVSQEYVSAIQNEDVNVLLTSKWLNAVLVEGSPSELTALIDLPFVSEITNMQDSAEPFNPELTTQAVMADSALLGNSFTQNHLIGIDQMLADGYTGNGITVAVFDNGFLNMDQLDFFQHIDIKGTFDIVDNETDVFDNGGHGLNVLSLMGSYKEGVMVGGAYNASYYLFRTEADAIERRIEEIYWLKAAEMADSLGVDIINSSLGYNQFDNSAEDYEQSELNGTTAWISVAANYAASKGMLVVSAAGNEGANSWGKVTFPADSPFVMAVGSVSSNGQKASSSSIGPTADDRIKPDIAAMGAGVTIVNPSGELRTSSGTSFASPLLAALAAGLWEQFPELTNFELMDKIKSSGSMSSAPDNQLGYGIASYIRAKSLITDLDQASPLAAVNLYPNPSDGTFKLQLDNLIGDQIKIQGWDLTGKLIFDQQQSVTTVTHSFSLPKSINQSLILILVSHKNHRKTFRVFID
ncbi:S8 family serine peptidase [Limibacter armeniacum]|uniref:S8 family serine peptidase n=1 Tax=Limibacter armeniacum TaxID=466084 RepID=UPI002FE59E73